MLTAHADVVLGEAIRPAAAAQARVLPSHWSMIVFPAIGMVVGTFAAFALTIAAQRLGVLNDLVSSLLWGFCALAGLAVGFRFAMRRYLATYLVKLRALGSPAIFPTEFRIEDEALVATSERATFRVAWPAILFVMRDKEHWLVQADTLTIAIPRRAFQDPEREPAAETAFVGAILDRISPEARNRSDNASQSRED
jgi:hypothetical protein